MGWLAKTAVAAGVIAVAGGAAAWWLASPRPLPAEVLASIPAGDATRGERVFWAGGCASCHAAPQAEGDDLLLLAGGLALSTDFGTFVAPNISQHPEDGIGNWTAAQLANAMLAGVSPGGGHYYPAFPYGSYARMDVADVADLHAFMETLPEVEGRAAESQLAFPFNQRWAIGLWKWLYLDDSPAVDIAGASDQVLRGQYLVEGPGHCGECHTPRSVLGGPDTSRWLAGAPSLESGRQLPNITPSDDGIGSWSEADIAIYLESGFTPDFDAAGGQMAAVVRNMARLPAEDREAIAAYLKAIPPLPD